MNFLVEIWGLTEIMQAEICSEDQYKGRTEQDVENMKARDPRMRVVNDGLPVSHNWDIILLV